MKIHIREYWRTDKEACVKAFKTNVPRYFTEAEVFEFRFFLDSIEADKTNRSHLLRTYYFVAVFDSQVLGGGFATEKNSCSVSLAWGFVQREFHGKGIGTKLLTHRLQQIQKLYPILPVVLDTTQYSAPFFAKFGFVTKKITNDFYAVGMHRYDMTLATK